MPLTLLLLLALSCFAQPLRQTQTRTKEDQKQQTAPAKETAGKADSAASTPIPLGMDKIQAKGTTQIKEPPGTQAIEPIASSTWLSTDGLVALFTGVLAVVAILQWRAIKEQARYMERALAETSAATKAAKESAEAARVSASATTRSNELTAESNAITRDATNLTQQSIVLSNPPKLSVRGVHLTAGSLRSGQTADGGFRIVNRGKTSAEVVRIWADAMPSPPIKPLPYEQLSKSVSIRLNPGEEQAHRFTSLDGAITEGILNSFNAGNSPFHVVIYIVYIYGASQAPISKTIRLCFGLDRLTGRFKRVPHPDIDR